MAQSARLSLPLLVPGQGQKDVTHNEALLSLELLVQPVVRSRTMLLPPETVAEGACWLVPEGASGAWNGQAHSIAGWTAGGWRFAPTDDGWMLWVADEAAAVRRQGDHWEQVREMPSPAAAVGAPSGGSVVDAQARSAIVALIGRLVNQGLLEP